MNKEKGEKGACVTKGDAEVFGRQTTAAPAVGRYPKGQYGPRRSENSQGVLQGIV